MEGRVVCFILLILLHIPCKNGQERLKVANSGSVNVPMQLDVQLAESARLEAPSGNTDDKMFKGLFKHSKAGLSNNNIQQQTNS